MDSKGHEYLSNEAIAAATKDFPPGLNWLKKILKETMIGSVYIDVQDIFGGHWSEDGQKHHFMRYEGQSPISAYNTALGWIKGNAHTAGSRIRQVLKGGTSRVDPMWIAEPMGLAVHSLQDSYSLGHVARKKDGNDWVITDLHVYDLANQRGSNKANSHHALDEIWNPEGKSGPDGKPDPLGKALGEEAVAAGRELIRIVVVSSIVKNDGDFEPKFDSLWETFASVFLVSRFASAK